MSDYPPPPPPGGYGTPPPPPGGGAYGGQPSGSPSYNVGDAVTYGWNKFQANLGQIIIAGVIAFVGIIVFQVISNVVIRGILVQQPECTGDLVTGIRCTEGSGFFVSVLLMSAISGFLYFLVQQVITAGIIRGTLAITQGRPFEYTELFKFDKIGPVVVTSLISAVIVAIGFILCILPGIIASFMLSYALYFVLDKDMSPMEAITASFNLVKDNVGTALVWAIVAFVITVVGALLCGIGLIVALPVAIIGTTYTYKLLTGQQVAA